MVVVLVVLLLGILLLLRMVGRLVILMVRVLKLFDVVVRVFFSSNVDENVVSFDVDSFILIRWLNFKGRVLGLVVEVYVISYM